MIATRTARWAIALTTTAIVFGATASGAAASNGPGRSGDAHAEHGHPNPDAVRGHDEEGKRGKGHESHGNGHGYGHGDHAGHDDVVVIIDEPAADQPAIESPNQTPTESPNQAPSPTPTELPNQAPNDVVVGNPVAQVLPSDSPVVPGVAAPSNANDPVKNLPASISDVVMVDEPAVTAANLIETRTRIVAPVGDVEIGAAGGFAGVILRHC